MELILCVSNSFIVCFVIFTVEYSDFSVPFVLVATYLKTQADLTVFKLIRPSRVVRCVGYIYSWSRGKETQPIFIFSHVAIFICNNNYLFYLIYLFNIYIYNIYLYLFIFISIYIIIIYLLNIYLYLYLYIYIYNI